MHAVFFGRTLAVTWAGFSVSRIGVACPVLWWTVGFFAASLFVLLIFFLRLVDAGSQDDLAGAFLDV
jgi:hypothetical protein